MAIGKEIRASTAYACHVDTIDAAEVERAKRLSVHARLCDQNVLAYQRHVLLVPFHMLLRADKCDDGFGIVLSTCKIETVVGMYDGVACGDAHVAVLQNAAAHEVASQELAYLEDGLAVERWVHGPQRHAVGNGMRIGRLLIFYLFLLLAQADAAEKTQREHGQDDAHHTEGVGTGIAIGYQGRPLPEDLRAGLRGGTQTGRVRHRATQNAHHHGQVDGIGSR